ncbi:N-acetylmuramoyl-L-alanine amidase-like domain-containing protein [Thermophagus sp. OGC60D27]|uniref:N-acetylmuramoyl-L-alanine amidase-like domain-containing protein n=1 Tax=Thermophagus sp. OGC60D27 TaxID=3458415 RepID=UPI004037A7B8
MRKEVFQFGILFLLMISFVLEGCHLKGTGKGDVKVIEKEESPQEVEVTHQDSVIFKKLMDWSVANNIGSQSLQDVILNVGKFFIGSPYVAHTLEKSGPEQLVINLREFDCTTFVENVLALSLCIKSDQSSLPYFYEKLRDIRYRKGEIEGYASRLHYFTDWLYDNEEMGFVKVVSNGFGDKVLSVNVDFMSAHADLYPKFAEDSSLVSQMKIHEGRISKLSFKYVSEEKIESLSDSIQDGDVIALCTSIEGLDVVHVGLAYHVDSQLSFIHASTVGNEVTISETGLGEYVRKRKHINGVLVARPVSSGK